MPFRGQVWHIRLTIHILSNSGNMVDCACLAGIVALKHFRRPEVEVVGDEVTIVRAVFVFGRLYRSDPSVDFNPAPSLRTRPCPTLNAPHSVLPHFCVLPRPFHTASTGPIPLRRNVERRSVVCGA